MDNEKKCTVYIDEAGDLGINRGTQWFVLSGVIVKHEDEAKIREVCKRIKSRLNINEIHFRKLRDFKMQCYVTEEFSKCNFCYINIIADTHKIDFELKNPADNKSVVIYNYACRYLLERVSWYLRDNNLVGDIVLSSRGTSRDHELITYIKDKLLDYDHNTISNRFKKVTSKTSSTWDLLQLADICATSTFYAYEENQYGHITPCFTKRLSSHLYNYNGRLKNYGIKYYSNIMDPGPDYFKERTFCR